ncbi:hypothetical protein GCM10018952_70730 [Streptosporangium vulgare]
MGTHVISLPHDNALAERLRTRAVAPDLLPASSRPLSRSDARASPTGRHRQPNVNEEKEAGGLGTDKTAESCQAAVTPAAPPMWP